MKAKKVNFSLSRYFQGTFIRLKSMVEIQLESKMFKLLIKMFYIYVDHTMIFRLMQVRKY